VKRSIVRVLRRAAVVTAVVAAVLGGLATPASAGPVSAGKSPYSFDLLAKAKPDECFNGIGQPYPPGPPCATGKP
jgi:hypothetical protein